MDQVNCPRCLKPLQVEAEICLTWAVCRDAGKLALAPKPEFGGGICQRCDKWIRPEEVK